MQKYLFSLTLIIVALSGADSFSQQSWKGHEYSYDLNGNRIRRESTLVYVKRGLDEDSTQVGATITAEKQNNHNTSHGSAANKKEGV